MRSSRHALAKSVSSVKGAWWNDGCPVASPTALAPAIVAVGTAPIFSSLGRKRARPSRADSHQSTPPFTVSGSPIASGSKPLSERCNRSREGPVVTSCSLKHRQKTPLNPGICRIDVNNPGLSEHLLSTNMQNHLILQGFARCQKVATPYSFHLFLVPSHPESGRCGADELVAFGRTPFRTGPWVRLFKDTAAVL